MKLDRMLGRLRREAFASPKKAAILGLLLLVAIWYWAPLIWGWIRPGETDTAQAVAPVAAPAASGETPVQPVASKPSGGGTDPAEKHTWNEIAQWMQNDPRMSVATALPGRPDPFDPVAPPPVEAAATADQQEQAKAVAAASAASSLDPESLGVAVSSTIVSAQGGTALIGGKSYQLGATVRVEREGQTIDFQLTAIRGDSVVLRRGKKDYEVRLPEVAPSGQIEINVITDE